MAKPNYQFEKRQKELAKKNKKEEKRQKKAANDIATGGKQVASSEGMQESPAEASAAGTGVTTNRAQPETR